MIEATSLWATGELFDAESPRGGGLIVGLERWRKEELPHAASLINHRIPSRASRNITTTLLHSIRSITEDERKQLAKHERIAIHVSNIANLLLFIAKVYASIESKSLAVIASTLDSFLDLLSGFILWFTSHAMKMPNQYHLPIGFELDASTWYQS